MPPEPPVFRKLRVFAFDPGMTAQLDTALINEVTLDVPWEPLQPGPIGEYVEVVEKEVPGQPHLPAVDLDSSTVLARDGLPPSDGNPEFHQQMVYAVAMRTIGLFESALGRPIHWFQGAKSYTPRLILLPHADLEANAHYNNGTINFGYVEADEDSLFPGQLVFTCLSQDIIVHQLTHAILHDMFPAFWFGQHRDVSAFSEGFCDSVALLSRFSLPDVVRHQIALSRGDLTAHNQLGLLAGQFAQAIGSRAGGIRSAWGEIGDDGVWRVKRPNPQDYRTLEEPHERGGLLLGVIFDAFNKVYRAHTADLMRVATEGTGVLPQGDLHPDLVDRLTLEATRAADRILAMCIRALDYCPPVEITFGDYLRAIITAAMDQDPAGHRDYLVAFIEAFRRYGIFPQDVRTLSLETLLWPEPESDSPQSKAVVTFVRGLARQHTARNLPHERQQLYDLLRKQADRLHKQFAARGEYFTTFPEVDWNRKFAVQSIFPSQYVGRDGEVLSQWVIRLVQEKGTRGKATHRWSGTTLMVDAGSGLVRYMVSKRPAPTRVPEISPLVLLGPSPRPVRPPDRRLLRVFASDPSAGTQLETAGINEVVLSVPMEPLTPGPVGEYFEVVDSDPATGCFYEPVDLEDKHVLAQQGYAPSQSIPQFHQQMVYAVAMRTVRNFERALGRLALWSPRWTNEPVAGGKRRGEEVFVRRLRLYPHALREANAYYSPDKKAVLFGYFQASTGEDAAPVTVFSALSHDIIAHEVTHALLDGMHRRFDEPSNPDVLAFHEAFADIVALFQHFSLPEVLRHQIAATRGDLASQNRLGELAQEFGSAIGNHGALRSAIGQVDPVTGEWKPLAPDPEAYGRVFEPHARGALLVATVFDAFLTMYRARIADLFRIATHGTGVLPAGSLHPDLVARLADEAAVTAQRVLDMCIRALDYCPPVDITFGEYLRALITADYEIDPVDSDNHRVAFIEAFRRHGILPDSVRAFSLEGLLWKETRAIPSEDENIVFDFIQDWTKHIGAWNLSRDRERLFKMMHWHRLKLHGFLADKLRTEPLSIIDPGWPFEVHSLRPALRIDWQGRSHLQWIIEITQRVPQFLTGPVMVDPPDPQARAARKGGQEPAPDYYFRGGVTLLVDADTGKVRYSIRKPLNSRSRRERQRKFMIDRARRSLVSTYLRGVDSQEPFAMLHRF